MTRPTRRRTSSFRPARTVERLRPLRRPTAHYLHRGWASARSSWSSRSSRWTCGSSRGTVRPTAWLRALRHRARPWRRLHRSATFTPAARRGERGGQRRLCRCDGPRGLEPYFTPQGISILAATCRGGRDSDRRRVVPAAVAVSPFRFFPFRLLGRAVPPPLAGRRRCGRLIADPKKTEEAEEDRRSAPTKPKDEVDKESGRPRPGGCHDFEAACKVEAADQGESADHRQVVARRSARTPRSRQRLRCEADPFELPSLDLLEPAEDFPYETLAAQSPGGRRRAGKDLQGLQPERARRRDRHGARRHAVRAGAGSRPAAVESRRAGRRPGDRASRARRSAWSRRFPARTRSAWKCPTKSRFSSASAN